MCDMTNRLLFITALLGVGALACAQTPTHEHYVIYPEGGANDDFASKYRSWQPGQPLDSNLPTPRRRSIPSLTRRAASCGGFRWGRASGMPCLPISTTPRCSTCGATWTTGATGRLPCCAHRRPIWMSATRTASRHRSWQPSRGERQWATIHPSRTAPTSRR